MRSIISTSRSLVSPSTGLNSRLCTGRTTLGKYNSKCTKNNNNNSKILQNIFNTTNILSSKKNSYTLKKAYDMLELGPIPESLQKYKNDNVILHLILGKKTRFWIGYIEIVKVKDFFIKIGHEKMKMNNNNNLSNKKLQTLSTLIAMSSGVKNINNNNNNNNPVSTPKRKSSGGASGIARALTAVAAMRL